MQPAAPQQTSAQFIPHPQATATEGPVSVDPEKGEGPKSFGSSSVGQSTNPAIPTQAPTQPPVDLLDSNPAAAPKTDALGGGAIHELD